MENRKGEKIRESFQKASISKYKGNPERMEKLKGGNLHKK